MGERNLDAMLHETGHFFEEAVKYQLRSAFAHQRNPEWRIIVDQHPWRNSERGEEGYIDLIVGRDSSDLSHAVRLIIECKLAREEQWVFLQPSRDLTHATDARCQWMECGRKLGIRVDVEDFRIIPDSLALPPSLHLG